MAAAGPGGQGRGRRSFHTHSPVGGPGLNPQAQVRAFQGKHLRGSWRVPRGPGMAQTSTFELPILLGMLQRCPGGGRGHCPVRMASSRSPVSCAHSGFFRLRLQVHSLPRVATGSPEGGLVPRQASVCRAPVLCGPLLQPEHRLGTAPHQLHGLAFLALSQLQEPPEGSWCMPMAGPGAPPDLVISVQPSRVGEVLAVLAGPGMLDLREHPRVRGGLRGSGRLHRPEVLHTVRKHFQLLAFWKGRPVESSVRSKYASNVFNRKTCPTPRRCCRSSR